MSCTENRLRFESLLRGTLDAAEASAIRAHLSTCDACTRELRETEQVDAMLGRWKADPGEVDVWPAVVAGLPKRSWTPMRMSAAAAVLLAAAGLVFHVAGRRTGEGLIHPPPPIRTGPSMAAAASGPEAKAIARHGEIAAANSVLPRTCYAYLGAYDEALNTRSYEAWSDRAAAAASPPEGVSAAGLLVAPAYVPRGSVLKRVEPAIATAEAAWTTPMGELTVLQSAGATAAPGFQTVVGGGREVKYTRFAAGSVDVTLVSEGLPWPEVERIKKGFTAGAR